jgi:prolipoprotein diacylglyceryltransferase
LSTERFLVEIVRVKDDRFLGPLTIAQVIAVGLILLGLWGMKQASLRAGASKGAAA